MYYYYDPDTSTKTAATSSGQDPYFCKWLKDDGKGGKGSGWSVGQASDGGAGLLVDNPGPESKKKDPDAEDPPDDVVAEAQLSAFLAAITTDPPELKSRIRKLEVVFSFDIYIIEIDEDGNETIVGHWAASTTLILDPDNANSPKSITDSPAVPVNDVPPAGAPVRAGG